MLRLNDRARFRHRSPQRLVGSCSGEERLRSNSALPSAVEGSAHSSPNSLTAPATEAVHPVEADDPFRQGKSEVTSVALPAPPNGASLGERDAHVAACDRLRSPSSLPCIRATGSLSSLSQRSGFRDTSVGACTPARWSSTVTEPRVLQESIKTWVPRFTRCLCVMRTSHAVTFTTGECPDQPRDPSLSSSETPQPYICQLLRMQEPHHSCIVSSTSPLYKTSIPGLFG